MDLSALTFCEENAIPGMNVVGVSGGGALVNLA